METMTLTQKVESIKNKRIQNRKEYRVKDIITQVDKEFRKVFEELIKMIRWENMDYRIHINDIKKPAEIHFFKKKTDDPKPNYVIYFRDSNGYAFNDRMALAPYLEFSFQHEYEDFLIDFHNYFNNGK